MVPRWDVEAEAVVSTSALTPAAVVEDRIVPRTTTVTEMVTSILARTRSQHHQRVGSRHRLAPLALALACHPLPLPSMADMEVIEAEFMAEIRVTTRLDRPLLMAASTTVRLPDGTSTVEIAGNMTAAEAVTAGAAATGKRLGEVQGRSILRSDRDTLVAQGTGQPDMLMSTCTDQVEDFLFGSAPGCLGGLWARPVCNVAHSYRLCKVPIVAYRPGRQGYESPPFAGGGLARPKMPGLPNWLMAGTQTSQ